MPFVVGLTGGIGSGKSKAADMFGELGAAVVDTDAISHALTAPGGAAMPDIQRVFGPEYLHADGSLDRARMRTLVFSDKGAKGRLEAVLHPLIRGEVARQIERASAPYVVLVVPLLLETGAYRELISRIAVVDCDETLQISRTMARSGLSEDEVRRIMRAQVPRAERLARADDVIRNDSGIDELRAQVQSLHRNYASAAGAER